MLLLRQRTHESASDGMHLLVTCTWMTGNSLHFLLALPADIAKAQCSVCHFRCISHPNDRCSSHTTPGLCASLAFFLGLEKRLTNIPRCAFPPLSKTRKSARVCSHNLSLSHQKTHPWWLESGNRERSCLRLGCTRKTAGWRLCLAVPCIRFARQTSARER